MLSVADLSAIAVAASAGAVQTEGAASAPSPLNLFEAACMNGAANLPRSSTRRTEYRRLPMNARRALGKTESGEAWGSSEEAPDASRVPNAIYQIGRRDPFFFIVPSLESARSARPAGSRKSYGGSCAVVWRGGNRKFEEATRLILRPTTAEFRLSAAALPSSNPSGLAFMSTSFGGYVVTAAALRGWLVLRAAPKSPDP